MERDSAIKGQRVTLKLNARETAGRGYPPSHMAGL